MVQDRNPAYADLRDDLQLLSTAQRRFPGTKHGWDKCRPGPKHCSMPKGLYTGQPKCPEMLTRDAWPTVDYIPALRDTGVKLPCKNVISCSGSSKCNAGQVDVFLFVTAHLGNIKGCKSGQRSAKRVSCTLDAVWPYGTVRGQINFATQM